MAPIKVGIIGVGQELSNTYKTGEWGIHHLHALVASPAYDVVAICNSTVESASRSIRAHGLDPQAVKAYGSAEDLAADPAVDLVVVAVHVDKHVQLAKPAIEAGKNVMVEFPLARDLAGCEELAQLAQKKGVRTMCGTQAYSDATYARLGRLVREGAVGEVVSVAVLGTSPISVAAGWPESAAMFLDIDGGANRIRIQLGHCKSPTLNYFFFLQDGRVNVVQIMHLTFLLLCFSDMWDSLGCLLPRAWRLCHG